MAAPTNETRDSVLWPQSKSQKNDHNECLWLKSNVADFSVPELCPDKRCRACACTLPKRPYWNSLRSPSLWF